MTGKHYRIVTLYSHAGIRFIHRKKQRTIDAIVGKIEGSKRYRKISLGIFGSSSAETIHKLDCYPSSNKLTLNEGIILGVYYDGAQCGSHIMQGPRVRVYMIAPEDWNYQLMSYLNKENPKLITPFSELSKKSDYLLLKMWFQNRNQAFL